MLKKLNVIFDNNVWFRVGDIDNPLILNHNEHLYITTAVNIIEFITDEHKYKTEFERNQLNNAIQAMKNNCTDVIFEDPIVYSALKLSNFQKQDNLRIEMEEIYNKLISYSEGKLSKLHGPTIERLHKYKGDFKEQTTRMGDRYNELAQQYSTSDKMKLEKIQGFSLGWFFKTMSDIMEQEIVYQDGQGLKKLDVFLRSYSAYLHRINPETGPKSNTVFDLLQLLYFVGNEVDLFWTLDKQIVKRINYIDDMFGTNDRSFIINERR